MGWSPSVQVIKKKGRKPYFRLRLNGKDHYLGTERAKAYKLASDLLTDPDSTPALSQAPTTVAELVVAWLRAHQTEENKTFLQMVLRPWWKWCGTTPLSDLADTHLTEYLQQLKKARTATPSQGPSRLLSNHSIQKFVRYASRCLRWAVEKKFLETASPLPRLPKAVQKPRDIQPERLKLVFEKLREPSKSILTFMVATGCRPSEAINLEWSQVDLARGTCLLEGHKTAHKGKSRTIYLTPQATSILQKLPNDSGLVFRNGRGKKYTVAGLRSILYRRGISSVYALRHTFAQSALGQGVAMEDVAKLLGHSDLRTVQTYAQVRDQRAISVATNIKAVV